MQPPKHRVTNATLVATAVVLVVFISLIVSIGACILWGLLQ